MQTVTTTPEFDAQAKRCGLTEDELELIVWTIAENPESGAIIPGTGGARKLRFAGRGHGKSGGYRTIHYFGGTDVPVTWHLNVRMREFRRRLAVKGETAG